MKNKKVVIGIVAVIVIAVILLVPKTVYIYGVINYTNEYYDTVAKAVEKGADFSAGTVSDICSVKVDGNNSIGLTLVNGNELVVTEIMTKDGKYHCTGDLFSYEYADGTLTGVEKGKLDLTSLGFLWDGKHGFTDRTILCDIILTEDAADVGDELTKAQLPGVLDKYTLVFELGVDE